MSTPAREFNWAALTKDALRLISTRLASILDYIRFRSVCISWRLAAPKKPQLPLFAIRYTDDEGKATIGFLNIFTSQILSLDRAASALAKPCIGSCNGWLALLDTTPGMFLLNPVTGDQVQLPLLTDYPEDDCGQRFSKVGEKFVCWNPDVSPNYSRGLEGMVHYFASKVIFSSNPSDASGDLAVLAIRCYNQRLGFCRPGDGSWNLMHSSSHVPFDDIYFYKEKFYACWGAGYLVCECDIKSGHVKEIPLMLTEQLVDDDDDYGAPDIAQSYLVESDGDLLLVLLCEVDHGSRRFGIYKVDFERMELAMLEGLGVHAVFLGRNTSISLAAGNFPGCKANSIYIHEVFVDGRSSVIVYNLGDGSSEVLLDQCNEPQIIWELLAWIMPTLY